MSPCAWLLGGVVASAALGVAALAVALPGRAARVLALAAGVAAALTVPWPPAWIAAAVTLAALLLRIRTGRRLVAALLALTCLREIAWLHLPVAAVPPQTPIVVIGDSLAAGLGASDHPTWPERVAARRRAPLVDLSVPGQTAGAARARLRAVPDKAVVIVELGGNDLFQGRDVADYGRDLDAVLAWARGAPGRTVLLVELPVPPLHGAWVAAQRDAAARHGATIVPRRVLASVLCDAQQRSDGVHLSPAGHAALAEALGL